MNTDPLIAVLLLVAGLLSGSVPVGVLVARAAGRPDPRTVGSGRIGGTNSLRALGRRWAAVVVAFDVLKGALPVLAARLLTGDPVVEVIVATAALVGSTRSIFLRFERGGRGIGTGVGTLLVLQPLAVVLAVPVFVAAIALTRYVSLGSLLGSLATAIWMIVLQALTGAVPVAHLAYAVIGNAIVWLAFGDNIQRLLDGTERRLDPRLLTQDEPTGSEG